MERGPGGHAPYVRNGNITNGKEYFESRSSASKPQFRREYSQAVSEDVDWFFSRVEELEYRELCDNTLIIYTSDHGELLGEEGMIGHSLPIHPKHVYVPTVFIHPDLSSAVKRETLVRHVDLSPTILSLIGSGSQNPGATNGRDLNEESLATRGATFYNSSKSLRSITTRFESTSVWDTNGGYIFSQSGRTKHALLGLKRLLRIPWRGYARRNLIPYLRAYLGGNRVYGTPGFTEDVAKKYASDLQSDSASQSTNKRVDVPKNRLEELGYLE
jgi:arylsulfatase A-like enzyme